MQGFRPEHHTANFIFRGTKADVWEAGHHVPFFVRYPGVVAPGSTCAETITHTDLFATVAAVIGEKLPPPGEGVAEDSHSLLGLLQGKPNARRGAPVVNHSVAGMFAIRGGKWKLVLGNGSGGREKPRGQRFARPYQLFDLDSDPSETTNVIEQHPDVAQRLERQCLEIMASGRSR
jgi:arylsulfatase A-like enzyme